MEDWGVLKTIFAEVLEQPAEKRHQFLTERCNGNVVLKQEVLALLGAYEEEGTFLAQAPVRLPALHEKDGNDVPEAVDLANRRLGAYRVIEKIGVGGMGAVYLAERDDELFHKRVAIKVIRFTGEPERLKRFKSEREILARLNHPNIAQLYDGGITEEGAPYLVMEYVEGVPIDTYCNTHRLSIEARLRLFTRVCRAVHYAHQNLIVHRDLKPSNIMVNAEGEPKLLDFGIAKLIESDTRIEERTVTRDQLMTPEYASPEQIRGKPVTTATDVYSLGVILYRLLTGQDPYHVPKQPRYEMERVICEVIPKAPSATIGYMPSVPLEKGQWTDPETVGRDRNTTPERLQRKLRGDLDTMVLMALRKGADRRYGSTEQFADDLNRYLGGLPVFAQKDTFGYRVRKFVYRHRVGVGVGVLAILFGIISVSTILIKDTQLRQEQQNVLAERDHAEDVLGYIQSMFELYDPERAGEATLVTAEQLLDRGWEEALAQLKTQPERQARMLNMLSSLYEKLGLFDKALETSQQAFRAQQEAETNQIQGFAKSIHYMALAHHAKGNYRIADSLYGKAYGLHLQHFGHEHVDVARNLHDWAVSLRDNARFHEADSLCREALQIRMLLNGPRHVEVADSKRLLATIQVHRGQYEEAEQLFNEALVVQRLRLGEKNVRVAYTLDSFGGLLWDTQRYDDAERLLTEALAIKKEHLGNQHLSVATTLNNLALVVQEKGDIPRAEQLFREVLDIEKDQLGDTHERLATSLNNLALLLKEKGEFQAAEPMYRQAIKIWKGAFGEKHPDVALGMHNLAILLRQKGDIDAAIPEYESAIEVYRHSMSLKHAKLSGALVAVGKMWLVDKQDPQRALPFLTEGVEIRQTHLPSDDWHIGSAQSLLGACLTELRQYEQAEQVLQAAVSTLEAHFGAEHRRVVEARDRLDALYRTWPNKTVG